MHKTAVRSGKRSHKSIHVLTRSNTCNPQWIKRLKPGLGNAATTVYLALSHGKKQQQQPPPRTSIMHDENYVIKYWRTVTKQKWKLEVPKALFCAFTMAGDRIWQDKRLDGSIRSAKELLITSGMVIRTPTFCYWHPPFIPVATNPIPVDSEPLKTIEHKHMTHGTLSYSIECFLLNLLSFFLSSFQLLL